jgi:phosphatidylglycerol:prolipoprotein diacylglycerol transferase
VIGGAVSLFFYSRRHGLNFAEWADISAPSLALGQAIGRWGNFVNQELYGAPTNLPWKLFIDPSHRLAGFEGIEYYHPLFLYESLWNIANMALLIWLTRQFSERLLHGDIFLVYLIVYPLGRFGLEFLRLDAAMLGGINANQTVMALVALVSVLVLLWRHRDLWGQSKGLMSH